MPGPVNVPKGRISFSTWVQADWKLDPQVAALREWKYVQSYGSADVSPADPPSWGTWRHPVGGSCKTQDLLSTKLVSERSW